MTMNCKGKTFFCSVFWCSVHWNFFQCQCN